MFYSSRYGGVGGTLILGAYDVTNAFGLLLHSQAMLELYNHGVSLDVIVSLYDMYHHLKIRLKLDDSPTIYNNAALPDQVDLPTSCVSKDVDTSVLCYAGDLLNLCRSITSLKCNFNELATRYDNISLSINAAKL
jgi:hypothetical protein